ncbi:OLC1v1009141C1 [Oldenlandia corymbosa var. corymbosa]|uniref:OLC1v1009141C1 n=1 Tax=Oldenlandia corymbosa var. corymbosa TaxID=529605 RepID=A0AAV1DPR2_OLDCO|nr:OLC1v1009141C1 [Oldenlandia corymbosa var. corymbosa]
MGDGDSSTFGEQFSRLAGIMFIWSTIQQLIPQSVRLFLDKLWSKLFGFYYPYVHITFHEYTKGIYNDAYTSIATYLGSTHSGMQSTYLTGDKSEDSKSLILNLDEGQEIIDEFNGVHFLWRACKEKVEDNSSSRRGIMSGIPQEKNSYVLVFHKKYRDMVTKTYLDHVIQGGKEIELNNRQRKLYTNRSSEDWFWFGGKWNYINFHHPATFDTLAMDPLKKQEIISDLDAFKKGKAYYTKIGKAWKRGYLLHGPPGTGKSTMIAAIANYMEYDIYDLELTSVINNSELKQLLIDTRSKSIIVIEDIDCSIDLTGKRKKKEASKSEEEEMESGQEDKIDKDSKSKLTLSGVLNFIDGIWSACGQERIIIFTTNHVDKLDPALIRRGRMDMHIEMSYCKFEAFKILAKNYLDIDSHPLYGDIRQLLEGNDVRPCDVAENLMPKTNPGDGEQCLRNLIQAINAAKEETRVRGKRGTLAKRLKETFLSKSTFKKSATKV